jgi:hypothetical protein
MELGRSTLFLSVQELFLAFSFKKTLWLSVGYALLTQKKNKFQNVKSRNKIKRAPQNLCAHV